MSGAQNSLSTSETDTTEMNTTQSTTITTSDPTITDQLRSDEFNKSTSWWTYVGWTSTSTSTATATATATSTLIPPMNDVAIAPTEVSVANEIPELNPTTPSTEVVVIKTTSLSPGNIVHGSLVENEFKAVEEIKPAEPAKETNGLQGSDRQQVSSSSASTWYTPWGWYSSTSAGRPEQHQSDGLGVKNSSEHEAPLPLAQDPEREPIPATSEAPEAGDTPPVPSYPPVNPIITSMETNWSSWASFFSSRALMAKRLGYTGSGNLEDVKRDEDGMEVMDLDDDDDEQKGAEETDMSKDSSRREQVVSPQPVTPTSITKTRPLLLKTPDSQDSGILQTELRISDNPGDQTIPAQSSTSKKGSSGSNTPIPIPLPPSPSPSSRGGIQSQSLSSTPPTSTSTKKVNNKAASPTPSKKSIPPSPPPPNLVLPTWEHTFNTAPRNVIPVTIKPRGYLDRQATGGKVLEKTMKFISGVLFAKDTHDGSLGSDKMKGKDTETSRDDRELIKKWETERFKEFGKELPKAWQIEEAGLDTDARPTSTPRFCSPESKNTIKGSPVGVGAGVDKDKGQIEGSQMKDVLRGCKRVVVIGIHGWFPGLFLPSLFFFRVIERILITCFSSFRYYDTHGRRRGLFFYLPSVSSIVILRSNFIYLFSRQGRVPSLPI